MTASHVVGPREERHEHLDESGKRGEIPRGRREAVVALLAVVIAVKRLAVGLCPRHVDHELSGEEVGREHVLEGGAHLAEARLFATGCKRQIPDSGRAVTAVTEVTDSRVAP